MSQDRHLSVDEARAAICAALQPVQQVETVAVTQAVGRTLAQDLISPMDVPPHINSAMDGFAFASADLAGLDGDAQVSLTVVGTAFAGQAFDGLAQAGQAVRIMTGAVMPEGLDTVVPQELAQVAEGRVSFAVRAVKPGENRRLAGEDLARGQVAVAAGRVLRPSDLGLAASLGFDRLQVRRRLKVALISTGDELRNPGEDLPEGCIYDSNRSSLNAALQRLGVEVVDLGLIPDQPAALEAAFTRAARECDAVLTSGGVSVGEADHTRALMQRLGDVSFWKVAMRPGRPFAFGPLRDGDHQAWLFALPGNPVAALVTFYVFVVEGLRVLGGGPARPPLALQVKSAQPIRKRPGRTEFQRAVVEPDTNGELTVRITGSQGAGILRSLSEANALLVLGHDQGSVDAGALVDVWLLEGLI
jgi:molybdopterin molybdotransferase